MKRKDYEKYGSWVGIDASVAESLCEYGLLMKWCEQRNEFAVIVRDDHTCHKQPMYCYEWFNFEEWIGEFDSADTWINVDGVLNYVGASSKDMYLAEVSPIQLLSDLLSYYSKTNILGEEYWAFRSLKSVIEDWELDKLEDFSEYI